MQKKVLVIGAGVSGLTLAYKLKKAGCEVKVLDKRSYAGGVVHTYSENGFKAESGSNSIMVNSPRTLDFFKEAGLEGDVEYASATAKKRYFVRYGKPQEVPMGPAGFLKTRLFSILGKMRLLIEPLISKFPADSDPSVEEFTLHRMGKEALDYAMNPFFGGIYAGDVKRLSMRYAFPPLWNLEQKFGSIILGGMKSARAKAAAGNIFKPVLLSFKDGMDVLPKKLAEYLGDSLELDAQIASIDHEGKWKVVWSSSGEGGIDTFDVLVLAVPAWGLKNLPICGTLAQALEPLDKIEGSPIATLTLGFRREDVAHALDGFGALVPEKENLSIIGSLFVSSMFENRAPKGYVTLTNFVGGTRNPSLAALSEEELLPIVMGDLRKVLGVRGEPVFKKRFAWKRSIAQYNVGYNEFAKVIKQVEQDFPDVKLLGSYRGGAGVSNCIESAITLADSILNAEK